MQTVLKSSLVLIAATAVLTLAGACQPSAPADAAPAPTVDVDTAPALASGALVDVVEVDLSDRPLPRFKADAAWPTLPADQIIGQVPGLAVDGDDNVWIVQRPNSLTPFDVGLAKDPPVALCCTPAPHVLQFDRQGNLLRAWGQPDDSQPDAVWPSNVHGLFVAPDDTVWIGGNGNGDHVVVNYTMDGQFIRAIGQQGQTGGNSDPTTLGNPADIFVDTAHGEILVADGYVNKRIVAFDDATGDFRSFWGAYASTPGGASREGAFDQSQASSNADGGADTSSPSFGDIVHCITRSANGDIYVCDRRNNRIQMFRPDEDGKAVFVKDIAIAPDTGGTRTASDIAFSPDGAFMYVADMMNSRVWILDAGTHEILGAFGRIGRYPGQFTWLHSVETDSAGNIYTTEVGTGRRVQRFTFQGVN